MGITSSISGTSTTPLNMEATTLLRLHWRKALTTSIQSFASQILASMDTLTRHLSETLSSISLMTQSSLDTLV